MVTIVPNLLLLALQFWSAPPQERPKENNLWLCWSHSGKGDSAIPIANSRTLTWFRSNLPEFDSEIKWRVTRYSSWRSIESEVKSVGYFHGHEVIDVLFSTPALDKPFGKLVLLGRRSEFRPIIWILNDVGVQFAPSRIITTAGRTVLVSRHWIGGTGNQYYDDYFTFDEKIGIPVNLAFNAAISAALSRILPEGRSLWRGGEFDILSLRYSAAVSNSGDPNCCPSAGRVFIQLGIRGNRLIIRKARYDAFVRF